jgi:DNA helicase-2/ATP-dependent DNA helicase PcrA
MPLTYNEFQLCIQNSISKFSQNWLNPEQDDAVRALPSPPVFIVAGPGTGKTTVLALRVLKHIFVDDYSPDSIMATTFTKKAASELRSRILSWGVATQQEALTQAQHQGNQQRVQLLQSLDINQVKTGTLDSLAEEMIADDRQPGEITPTVIEGFMAKGLLRKNVMFTNGRHNSNTLQTHLRNFNRQFPRVNSFSSKLKVCHSFADRVIHDGVDINAYSNQGQGHQILAHIVDDYHNYLTNNLLMDFALLEREMFNRLQEGRLQSTTENLNALLVDEFQDTNYLQEQIYYLLCQNSGAALTVVGDDDQSIYRFRGATVEIFANFSNRIQTVLGTQWNPTRINLINNYRSSERIVELFNHFINADPSFQGARVPNKQPCIASANWANEPNQNIPVLGMFRTNVQDLANDICELLADIFQGNGRAINISNNQHFVIQSNPNGGDFGDAVLLAGKVQEVTQNGRNRFPLLVRQQLNNYGVEIFNPRGRDFATIPEVTQCLGIMLECIDPNATLQNSITSIKNATMTTLNNWRDAGRQFAQSNPIPNLPPNNSLQQFMNDWAQRNAPNMNNWPSEWPLLELLFTVASWFPLFQTSPEGQIYIETIARTITEASQVSSYGSMIKNEGTVYDDKSVKDAIREVFEPIAEGEVEVDEDIMPYVPRAVFPVMTVHQAKGLEFPLVIVDVGSDFSRNHPAQKYVRFPDQTPDLHLTEDELANYSPVGQARQQRTGIERAFDDITRQYFVAKSRPQHILILVGLTTQLNWRPNQNSYQVPSVATGDLRNGGRNYNFVPAGQWTSNSPANTIALI